MQKAFTTFLSFLLFTITFAQKNEFRFGVHSAVFSFRGASAETTSFINYSDHTKTGYTNNPYGSKNSLGFGLSANYKHVSKHQLISGIGIGFEQLKSKISINEISGYTGTSTYQYNANGQTFLNFDFINFNPSLGYRFYTKNIGIDATGEIDLAYCISATENGEATATNDIKYITSIDRKTIKTDIRPGVKIEADYKKLGLFTAYKLGIVNYKEDYVGDTNKCYSRLLQFGATYLLN